MTTENTTTDDVHDKHDTEHEIPDEYLPDTRFTDFDKSEMNREIRKLDRKQERRIAQGEQDVAEAQANDPQFESGRSGWLDRLPSEKNNGVVPGLSCTLQPEADRNE